MDSLHYIVCNGGVVTLSICVAGTFDILHAGHKKLLKYAVELAREKNEPLLVGVTSDIFANKNRNRIVNSFVRRKGHVHTFLSEFLSFTTINFYEIDDAITLALRSHITSIVVSEETRSGADTINKKREERGIPPLDVYVVSMETDENGEEIHASRIVAGEINKDGKVLHK